MCRSIGAIVAWLGIAGMAGALVYGQPPGQSVRRPDVAKSLVVEAPAAALMSRVGAPAPRAANTASTAPLADNPSVAPGKVRWHVSLREARKAAEKSGKPVLLFHLLGNLDQEFC